MFVVLIGFTDSPDVCCFGSLHNIDTNMFDSRARVCVSVCVCVCARARACVRARGSITRHCGQTTTAKKKGEPKQGIEQTLSAYKPPAD